MIYTNEDAKFDAEAQGRCPICGRTPLDGCTHCDICGDLDCDGTCEDWDEEQEQDQS